MVRNHVLRLRSHITVKLISDHISNDIPPQMKILNTVINPLNFTTVQASTQYLGTYCICMRGSRNFRQGGSRSILQKKALTFFVFFLSSAYLSEVKQLISKKTIIFQGSRGGPTFSRVTRVQLLIPYRNPYNLWFSRGGGGGGGVRIPCPPPSGSALDMGI